MMAPKRRQQIGFPQVHQHLIVHLTTSPIHNVVKAVIQPYIDLQTELSKNDASILITRLRDAFVSIEQPSTLKIWDTKYRTTHLAGQLGLELEKLFGPSTVPSMSSFSSMVPWIVCVSKLRISLVTADLLPQFQIVLAANATSLPPGLDSTDYRQHAVDLKQIERKEEGVKGKNRGPKTPTSTVLYELPAPVTTSDDTKEAIIETIIGRITSNLLNSDPRRGQATKAFRKADIEREMRARSIKNFSKLTLAQLKILEFRGEVEISLPYLEAAGISQGIACEIHISATYCKSVEIDIWQLVEMTKSPKKNTARLAKRMLDFVRKNSSAHIPTEFIPRGTKVRIFHIGRYSQGSQQRRLGERGQWAPLSSKGERIWNEAVHHAGGKNKVEYVILSDHTGYAGEDWSVEQAWDEAFWGAVFWNPLMSNLAWPGGVPPLPPLFPGEIYQPAATYQVRITTARLSTGKTSFAKRVMKNNVGLDLDVCDAMCLSRLGYHHEDDLLGWLDDYRPSTASEVAKQGKDGSNSNAMLLRGLDIDTELVIRHIQNVYIVIHFEVRLYIIGHQVNGGIRIRPGGTTLPIHHERLGRPPPSAHDYRLSAQVAPSSGVFARFAEECCEAKKGKKRTRGSTAGGMAVNVRIGILAKHQMRDPQTHGTAFDQIRFGMYAINPTGGKDWLLGGYPQFPVAFQLQPEAVSLLLGRTVAPQSPDDLHYAPTVSVISSEADSESEDDLSIPSVALQNEWNLILTDEATANRQRMLAAAPSASLQLSDLKSLSRKINPPEAQFREVFTRKLDFVKRHKGKYAMSFFPGSEIFNLE